ncbi:hypothetical protein C8F01DRAFT_387296 [Mycena amicta]|nr:hypothetical protein C8F01DRAFT_387296 [Mycena amicta]
MLPRVPVPAHLEHRHLLPQRTPKRWPKRQLRGAGWVASTHQQPRNGCSNAASWWCAWLSSRNDLISKRDTSWHTTARSNFHPTSLPSCSSPHSSLCNSASCCGKLRREWLDDGVPPSILSRPSVFEGAHPGRHAKLGREVYVMRNQKAATTQETANVNDSYRRAFVLQWETSCPQGRVRSPVFVPSSSISNRMPAARADSIPL